MLRSEVSVLSVEPTRGRAGEVVLSVRCRESVMEVARKTLHLKARGLGVVSVRFGRMHRMDRDRVELSLRRLRFQSASAGGSWAEPVVFRLFLDNSPATSRMVQVYSTSLEQVGGRQMRPVHDPLGGLLEQQRRVFGEALGQELFKLGSGEVCDAFVYVGEVCGEMGAQHVVPVVNKYYQSSRLEFSVEPAVVDPVLSKELKASCPSNVFDIEDGVVKLARPDACVSCGRCAELARNSSGVEAHLRPVEGVWKWRVDLDSGDGSDAEHAARLALHGLLS